MFSTNRQMEHRCSRLEWAAFQI